MALFTFDKLGKKVNANAYVYTHHGDVMVQGRAREFKKDKGYSKHVFSKSSKQMAKFQDRTMGTYSKQYKDAYKEGIVFQNTMKL